MQHEKKIKKYKEREKEMKKSSKSIGLTWYNKMAAIIKFWHNKMAAVLYWSKYMAALKSNKI